MADYSRNKHIQVQTQLNSQEGGGCGGGCAPSRAKRGSFEQYSNTDTHS